MKSPEIVGALIPLAVLVLIDTKGVYYSIEQEDAGFVLCVLKTPAEHDATLREEVQDASR